jgi:hypothetical protein
MAKMGMERVGKRQDSSGIVETMTNPAPYNVYSCSFLPA